jgi:hypothetical protein
MHGQGTFVWADGRKYVGAYVNDRKEGHGSFLWTNGKKFEGEWLDGKWHGFGDYTAEGVTKRGEWAAGKIVQWFDIVED